MVKGMTGPDRARCYALALGTGFRAAELGEPDPRAVRPDRQTRRR